jgi:hypothetical protein
MESSRMAPDPHRDDPAEPRRPDLAGVPQAHGGIGYLKLIEQLHATLQPSSYLEIGTARGVSLALAQCDAIAVDPKFQFAANPAGSRQRTLLAQQPSDAFFRSGMLPAMFPDGVDLAFLDGLHLFEFLLRDLINVCGHLRRNSVVLLHDCLPLTEAMAARRPAGAKTEDPRDNWWTGDVWKVLYVVRACMPEAVVTCLDCPPTGLVCLTNLDAGHAGLMARYFELVREFGDIDQREGWLPRLYQDFPVESSRRYLDASELHRRFWL